MATKKTETKTTRLTHLNGATVVVDADKADALVAGGTFSVPATKRTASTSDK